MDRPVTRMSRPGPGNGASRADAAGARRYGVIRSALITLGVFAFTFLLSRHDSGPVSGAGYVLAGLALQVLLICAHAIIRRRAPDPASAAQVTLVLELIADGITVLLFAMGTLGGVLRAAGEI